MLFALLIVLAIAFVLTQPGPFTQQGSVSAKNADAAQPADERWRICTGV
jgi:hypothetical protein